MSDIVLLENEFLRVVLPSKGLALGHLKVFPARRVKYFDDLSPDERVLVFRMATVCSSLLFEGLKAEGTNIIISEGDVAVVDVVARRVNDGLSFVWTPKKFDLKEVSSALKDKMFFVGKKQHDVEEEVSSKKVSSSADSDEAFFEGVLRRIP